MDMQGLPLDAEEVRPFYADADPIHDFDHVMRVAALGWHLARAEGADPEIVRTAALLHDVPVAGTAREEHHVVAAEQASSFLVRRGVPAAAVDLVVDCIKGHRFRNRGAARNSLEAKCLYDADKIDVLGAIGIVRAFAYAGLHGHSLCDPVAVVNVVRTQSLAIFPRLVVVVGDGAEAQVVNALVSGEGEVLAVPVAELDVGPAARLEYLNLQELGPQATGIDQTAATVATQGHLVIGLAAVGGTYARCRVDCTLAGRGATGDMSAMYFGDRDQILDFRTYQNHLAPDTNSNLLFVGAVEDRARSIYSGLIRVGPKARGTDAEQTNRILKLSEEVWADSVPTLESENNDVRCAHASSVGPVDEDHRFYLESRGVPPDVAERLIVEGFFREVRRRLPVQSVAAGFDEMVRAKIGPEQ